MLGAPETPFMTDDAEEKEEQSEALDGFDLPEDDAATGIEPPDVEEEDGVVAPPEIPAGAAATPAGPHVRKVEEAHSVKGKIIALVVIPLAAIALVATLVIRKTTVLQDLQNDSLAAATKFMKGMPSKDNELFIAAIDQLTEELRDDEDMDINAREDAFKDATGSMGVFKSFRDVRWVEKDGGVNYDEFSATAVFGNGTLPVWFRFRVYRNRDGTFTHRIGAYKLGASDFFNSPTGPFQSLSVRATSAAAS